MSATEGGADAQFCLLRFRSWPQAPRADRWLGPRQPRRYCREILQMPIRPHQASDDEGFGIRVTRVGLHR